MSYKIIVVQIDEADASLPRMELAASIALAEHAHLVGAAVASPRPDGEGKISPSTNANVGSAPGWGHEAAFERFERIAIRSGVASFEKRLIEGDPSTGFSHQGRHSDLLVLAQGNNAPEAVGLAADFVEYVVMNAGCPVLVVPGANFRPALGNAAENRILIGWNESVAAARAVRDAMPFLARARELHLAVLDAGLAPQAGLEAPGAEIAVYLDRHGLPVEVHRRPAGENAGHALLDLAHRLNCGLLVMGGVAHPHGRAMLLGGATRSVLTSARIPVLMSH
jgi:nucleotide-binding universal stress UspA family protein